MRMSILFSRFFIFILFMFLALSTSSAALHLVEHSFLSNQQHPDQEFELVLLFDNPVNAEKAGHYISLADEKNKVIETKIVKGNKEAAASIGGTVDRVLVLSPIDPVKSGTKCVVSLAPGLSDESGSNSLALKKTISFETNDYLKLISFEAMTSGVDSSKMILRFNKQLKRSTLRRAITVSPYVYCYPSNANGNYNEASKYYLNGGFKPGKEYRIKISSSLLSLSGRKLATDRVLKVTMPPVTPAVSFIEANRVIELKSRQLMHVAVVNVDNVTCEVISVPPNLVRTAYYGQVERAIGGKVKRLDAHRVEGKSYEDGKTSSIIKGLKDSVNDISALTFPSPAKISTDEVQLHAERFFCSLNEYQSKAFSIPLTFREEKEKGGTFLVRVGDDSGKTSSPYRLFQITDLAITVKESPANLLVWVTSIETGKPVEGVDIYCETADLRHTLGKTDKDGLIFLDRKKDYGTATVSSSGDVALMTLDDLSKGILLAKTENDFAWFPLQKDVMELPAQVQARSGSNSSSVKGKAFTDRGIYKPGDKVNFKAVLRDFSGDEPVIPSEKLVTLEVTGPTGDNVYKEEIPVSDFGSVFGTVQMKKFHRLGTYRMYFRSKYTKKTAKGSSIRYKTICSTSFELQEFRPPRHKVRIEFDTGEETDNRFVGRKVTQNYLTAVVKGLYYAGGPVKHGKASWSIKYSPASFDVKDEDDFEFKSELLKPSALLEHGEGILDARGELTIKVPVPEEVMNGSLGLTVEATVLDFDGRPATSSDSYSKRPEILVGTGLHDLNVEMGTVAELKAIVIGKDGKRVASGIVDVEVMRQRWLSIRKRDATGQIRWMGEDVFSREFVAPVSIIDGVATFDFDFRSGGEFLIRFHYKSEDGTVSTASSRYYVDGYYYGSDEREKREKLLTMNPDKLAYRSGDVASIAIRGRRKAATYLVTVERDNIVDHRVITLEAGKGMIDVPIEEDYSPNVYVSVIAPSTRSRFPIYSSDADIFRPVSLFGACRLNIKTAAKQLDIKLTAEPSQELPQPGEIMTVNIEVTDDSKTAVNAEVALCVVDEGILALTGFKTPELTALFAETLLSLNVKTSDLRSWLLGQSPGREFFSKPFTGGGGGDNGSVPKIQERKDFNPLAFWKADILTGDDGKATVSFKLPDTITSYRVYAVAVDKKVAYGSSEIQQKVVKPFYLEPGLPRFAVRGDKFDFSVVMFNKTEKKDSATLYVETSKNVEITIPKETFTLEPYSSIKVPVKFKAVKTGMAELSFTGIFGLANDKVKSSMKINSRLTMVDRIAAGSFDNKGKAKLDFPPDINDIPVDELEAMTAVVTLTDNPLIKLAPGLKYLLNYPHGCIEQTSSGVMSLAGLRSVVKRQAIPGMTCEDVDKYLRSGVERILSMQLSSGGFSYWPGGSSAHSYGTGIAVTALTMAEKAEFEVPSGPFNKAITYLQTQSRSLVKDTKVSTRKALGLYAAACRGKAEKKVMLELSKNLDKFGAEAQALFLMGALKTDYISRDFISAKFNELVSHDGATGEKVSFDPYDFSSSERKAALLLLLACELDERDSIAPMYAEMLRDKIGPHGRWRSTHDTGWCLLALARYYDNVTFSDKPFKATVVCGKTEVLTITPGVPSSIMLDSLRLQKNPVLNFKSPSGHTVYYSVRYKIPLTEALRRTMKQGYSIVRKYTLPGNVKRAIRVGDVVKVELDIVLGGKGNYLALEDPLPSGLVAVNSKLKTEPAITNAADEGYGYSYDGWWSFTPQHFEMRDDRVMAYRNHTWGTHYTYSYFARAVVSGTFQVPAAKIQEMYRPSNVGFAPAQTIEIAPLKP